LLMRLQLTPTTTTPQTNKLKTKMIMHKQFNKTNKWRMGPGHGIFKCRVRDTAPIMYLKPERLRPLFAP
jgi:hypothetical protein